MTKNLAHSQSKNSANTIFSSDPQNKLIIGVNGNKIGLSAKKQSQQKDSSYRATNKKEIRIEKFHQNSSLALQKNIPVNPTSSFKEKTIEKKAKQKNNFNRLNKLKRPTSAKPLPGEHLPISNNHNGTSLEANVFNIRPTSGDTKKCFYCDKPSSKLQKCSKNHLICTDCKLSKNQKNKCLEYLKVLGYLNTIKEQLENKEEDYNLSGSKMGQSDLISGNPNLVYEKDSFKAAEQNPLYFKHKTPKPIIQYSNLNTNFTTGHDKEEKLFSIAKINETKNHQIKLNSLNTSEKNTEVIKKGNNFNKKNENICFSCDSNLNPGNKNKLSNCKTHSYCTHCIVNPKSLNNLKMKCQVCFSEFSQRLKRPNTVSFNSRSSSQQPITKRSIQVPETQIIKMNPILEITKADNRLSEIVSLPSNSSFLNLIKNDSEIYGQKNQKIINIKNSEHNMNLGHGIYQQSENSSVSMTYLGKGGNPEENPVYQSNPGQLIPANQVNFEVNPDHQISQLYQTNPGDYNQSSQVLIQDQGVSQELTKSLLPIQYLSNAPANSKIFLTIDSIKPLNPATNNLSNKWADALYETQGQSIQRYSTDEYSSKLYSSVPAQRLTIEDTILFGNLKPRCLLCSGIEQVTANLCNHNICEICLTYNCFYKIYEFFYQYQIKPDIIKKSFNYSCPVEDCKENISVPTLMIIQNYNKYIDRQEICANFLCFREIMSVIGQWIQYFDGLPYHEVFG